MGTKHASQEHPGVVATKVTVVGTFNFVGVKSAKENGESVALFTRPPTKGVPRLTIRIGDTYTQPAPLWRRVAAKRILVKKGW